MQAGDILLVQGVDLFPEWDGDDLTPFDFIRSPRLRVVEAKTSKAGDFHGESPVA